MGDKPDNRDVSPPEPPEPTAPPVSTEPPEPPVPSSADEGALAGVEPEEPLSSAPPPGEQRLADVAAEARLSMPTRGRAKTRNFILLGAILLGSTVLGAWFFAYSEEMRVRNAHLRLDGLIRKSDEYKAQVDFISKNGFHPYGPPKEPLTPEEFESLQSLRMMFRMAPLSAADTQPAPLPPHMTPPPVVDMTTIADPTTRSAAGQTPPSSSQPSTLP